MQFGGNQSRLPGRFRAVIRSPHFSWSMTDLGWENRIQQFELPGRWFALVPAQATAFTRMSLKTATALCINLAVSSFNGRNAFDDSLS